MNWISLRFSVAVLVAVVLGSVSSDVSPDTVRMLKQSLNRLVRQQDHQLNHFKTELEAVTLAEIQASVFAISEVFAETTQLWLAFRSQYLSVEPSCAQLSPYSPQTVAAEAITDFSQCMSEVEANFNVVTAQTDRNLSSHGTAKWKLNFWLQKKLFAQSQSSFPSLISPLNALDATATANEIFHEAVLWDNVHSMDIYRGIKALPQSLTNAGEFGFFCTYNARNKFFQKWKTTEAFLNTNCAAAASQVRKDTGNINNTRDAAVVAITPEVVVALKA